MKFAMNVIVTKSTLSIVETCIIVTRLNYHSCLKSQIIEILSIFQD